MCDDVSEATPHPSLQEQSAAAQRSERAEPLISPSSHRAQAAAIALGVIAALLALWSTTPRAIRDANDSAANQAAIAVPPPTPTSEAEANTVPRSVPAEEAIAGLHPFALVAHDGAPRLILARVNDSKAALGPASIAQLDVDQLVAHRPASITAATKEQGAWIGTRARLFSMQGAACEADVVSLGLITRVAQPASHGLARVTRPATASEGAQLTPLPGAEDRAFKESGAELYLVADLLPTGSCDGAQWAQPASAPDPYLAPGEQPSEALLSLANSAFKTLPDYLAIQQRYARVRKPGTVEEWEKLDSASISVEVFQHQPSGVTFVLATAVAFEGCGGFSAQLDTLWELVDEDTLLLRFQRPDPVATLGALGAVDLDGDGRPELLLSDGVAHIKPGKPPVFEFIRRRASPCP